MEKVKLSSKGQVILPKSVRNAHGWQAGMEFILEEVAEMVKVLTCCWSHIQPHVKCSARYMGLMIPV